MRAAAFLLLAASAFADVVHLKSGKTIEGKISREDGAEVAVRITGGGEISIVLSEVEWVEWSDANAAREEFDRRRKPGTAEALVDAGRWAAFHGMKAESSSAFRGALKKDPDCAAAHEALGHRQFEGKWLTEDEYLVATGHVKWNGQWITKEEKEKLDQGWEFVDGKLLSPDEVKESKGLVKCDGKWITKKEFDEIQKQKAADEEAAKPPGDRLHDPDLDAAILKYYGDGWRVRSGQRYRLVTNCTDKKPKFDEEIVEYMDKYWDTYVDTFGVRPLQKKLETFVIYADRDSFRTAKETGGQSNAYGVYLGGAPCDRSVLWHDPDYYDGVRAALYTARHECGHQFVGHYVRPDGGPGWFMEGVVTIFEPDTPLQEYDNRWDPIHAAVIDGKGDLSMKELLTKPGLTTTQIYCLGAATHLFFLNYKDHVYKAAYQEFLRKGKLDSPESLEKYIGKPVADLDKEYREFIRELDGKRKKK